MSNLILRYRIESWRNGDAIMAVTKMTLSIMSKKLESALYEESSRSTQI
jgi:hypothetical protein